METEAERDGAADLERRFFGEDSGVGNWTLCDEVPSAKLGSEESSGISDIGSFEGFLGRRLRFGGSGPFSASKKEKKVQLQLKGISPNEKDKEGQVPNE